MSWVTLTTLALFAHIVGALLLFVGIGALWISALRLRSARIVAQAREWSGLARVAGRIGPIAGVLILVPGIYLMATEWGATPWILVTIGAMLLLMMPGMIIAGRGLGAIRVALAASADGDALPADVRRQIERPMVWTAVQVWAATSLGVVFLMTTKPGWTGSLVVIAVAVALGLAVGVLSGPRRAPGMMTTPMREASVR